MLIQKKLIKDMDRAAYNPRVDLRPGDDEYEALKDSLTEFGLVIPIIWNQRTNRVVGGHQRLTVEEDLGHTEVYVSVVNLDEMQEKQLNIALNKAQGAWDDGKLAELMNSLGNRAQDTGFTLPEIEALTSRIEDALDEDFLDGELGEIEETFNVTLEFPVEMKDEILGYIKEHGKEELVELMIEAARREECDMGCSCGSQVILCNLPVRFDTYVGCSHGCRYCFAQKKTDISKIRKGDTPQSLRDFIEGKRGYETHWVDLNIPIHWGGMSDPFQPIELMSASAMNASRFLLRRSTRLWSARRAASLPTRNTLTCWPAAIAWCR